MHSSPTNKPDDRDEENFEGKYILQSTVASIDNYHDIIFLL